jgi:hypothetical protein
VNDNEINDLFRPLPPCGSESGLDSAPLESSLSYCSYREGQEDQLGALGLVVNFPRLGSDSGLNLSHNPI